MKIFEIECKPGMGMTLAAVWMAHQRSLQGYRVVGNVKGLFTEREVDFMESLDILVKKVKANEDSR